MKILIAEDDALMGLLITDVLTDLGHEVVCTYDGSSAIDLLGSQHFDAVITDVQMPRCSGLEVLSFMRSSGNMTPCLVHSSEPYYRDRKSAQTLDLSTIPRYHENAVFHLKPNASHGMGYIENWLKQLTLVE